AGLVAGHDQLRRLRDGPADVGRYRDEALNVDAPILQRAVEDDRLAKGLPGVGLDLVTREVHQEGPLADANAPHFPDSHVAEPGDGKDLLALQLAGDGDPDVLDERVVFRLTQTGDVDHVVFQSAGHDHELAVEFAGLAAEAVDLQREKPAVGLDLVEV